MASLFTLGKSKNEKDQRTSKTDQDKQQRKFSFAFALTECEWIFRRFSGSYVFYLVLPMHSVKDHKPFSYLGYKGITDLGRSVWF